jgi:hypothetical protein
VEWEDHHISVGTGGVCRNPHWDDAEYRHVFATLVTHCWAHDAFLTPDPRADGSPGRHTRHADPRPPHESVIEAS